jgi:hypothetical protein
VVADIQMAVGHKLDRTGLVVAAYKAVGTAGIVVVVDVVVDSKAVGQAVEKDASTGSIQGVVSPGKPAAYIQAGQYGPCSSVALEKEEFEYVRSFCCSLEWVARWKAA